MKPHQRGTKVNLAMGAGPNHMSPQLTSMVATAGQNQ